MKEFDKWMEELAQQHPMLYSRKFFCKNDLESSFGMGT
ncbi:hypothetical protein LCGC14_1117510 [marine sediment metagenome]|uniref:Uncharacterized protein n=1 Tax=marine sediment metagenome TaxID=412755 RepID=A0A0F9M9S7_9ZZZZ